MGSGGDPDSSRGPGSLGNAPAPALPPLVPIALFLGLTVASWRRTGDIIRDWGRELYTPWRLSLSESLYRDVESLFGPLSQSFNGAVFTAFGPGHSVLLVTNLLLLALSAALVWDIARRLSDRRTADLSTVAFLCIFAFGHLTPLGNYNFLTPYAHEATHGILFCLATAWGVLGWLRSGSRRAAAVAGLAAGCAWLTKPEIGLAATAALVTGCLVARRSGLGARHSVPRIMLPAFAAPALIIGLAIAVVLGPGTALRALARPLAAAAAADPLSDPFYREWMGLDRPARNAALVFGAGLAVPLAYVGLASLAHRISPSRSWWPVALSVGPLAAVLSVSVGGWRLWLAPAWILPAACAIGLAGLAPRNDAGTDETVRRAGIAMWAALSSVLLLKLFLHPRFYHYGFYLALPATLLAIVLAAYDAPRWLESRRADPRFARGLTVGFVYALSAVLALASMQALHRRSADLLSGRDRLHVRGPESDARTGTVRELLDALPPLLTDDSAGTSLSVLPEGASLNYWLRTRGGSPYPVLLPPELRVFGEENVLRSFEADPPDVVVTMRRDMEEYGLRADRPVPGAPRLSEWIERSYCEQRVVHAISREGEDHGATIWRRRTSEVCFR